MVTVRISETYDLSTQLNKMGIIGIHTPTTSGMFEMYSGLFKNHRFARLVGCDVTLACASMLPADPLQIGTEAGTIAPQDMFNPILYTAVSNDSFNTIQRRIMASDATHVTDFGSIVKNDFTNDNLDQFQLYYGLLADADGWRKAMPQNGLKMEGLYPIVYQLVNTFGTGAKGQGTTIPPGSTSSTGALNTGEFVPDATGEAVETYSIASTLRGPSMRMPKVPLHLGIPDAQGTTNNWFPLTYVACIVVPPAKLNKLYYRMKVTWTIEFLEVCPTTEYDNVIYTMSAGQSSYGTDYAEQSSKMDTITTSVDVKDAEIEHVMTSSR